MEEMNMTSTQERKLQALEAQYMELLQAALRDCAKGRWGLFGHNQPALESLGKQGRSRLLPSDADELLGLGAEIEHLRQKLGFGEPFSPHERLMAMRSSVDANTPGEPRRAREWLDEING